MNLSSALGRLRVVGFFEGVSFLLLLGVAMPLKYFAGMPEAVRFMGMAHGVLFLAYIATVFQVHTEHDWPWRRTAGVFIAALLPFGPFVVDRRVLRGLKRED